MILSNSDQTVVTNVKDGKRLIIEDNPTLYEIIFNRLYTEPITAIVRELITNAIDANKDAGRDISDFEVHLPTVNDNVFFVKDNGTGMSDTEVDTVYRHVFKSSKSLDNSLTGMFGIGSKTPLAYTKSFVVDTIKDNLQNVYVVYRDDNYKPNIKHLTTIVNKQYVGTKVSLTVDVDDLNSFYYSLIKVIPGWPSLPKLTNTDGLFAYMAETYKKSCNINDLITFNQAFTGNLIPKELPFDFIFESNVYVEMGNVIYPVNVSKVNKATVNYIEILTKYGHHIAHIPIGSVDIASSREDLQYTEKTIQFLEYELKNLLISELDYSDSQLVRLGQRDNSLRIEESHYIPELAKNMSHLTDDNTNKLLKIVKYISDDDTFVRKIANESRNGLIVEGDLYEDRYVGNDVALFYNFLPGTENASNKKLICINLQNGKASTHLGRRNFNELRGNYITSRVRTLTNENYIIFILNKTSLDALSSIGLKFDIMIDDISKVSTGKIPAAKIPDIDKEVYDYEIFFKDINTGKFTSLRETDVSIKDIRELADNYDVNFKCVFPGNSGTDAWLTDTIAVPSNYKDVAPKVSTYRLTNLFTAMKESFLFVYCTKTLMINKHKCFFSDFDNKSAIARIKTEWVNALNTYKSVENDYDDCEFFKNTLFGDYISRYTWPETSNFYKAYKISLSKKPIDFSIKAKAYNTLRSTYSIGIYEIWNTIENCYKGDELEMYGEIMSEHCTSTIQPLLESYPLIKYWVEPLMYSHWNFSKYDENVEVKVSVLVDQIARLDGAQHL